MRRILLFAALTLAVAGCPATTGVKIFSAANLFPTDEGGQWSVEPEDSFDQDKNLIEFAPGSATTIKAKFKYTTASFFGWKGKLAVDATQDAKPIKASSTMDVVLSRATDKVLTATSRWTFQIPEGTNSSRFDISYSFPDQADEDGNPAVARKSFTIRAKQ
jgi:hypothetical protein